MLDVPFESIVLKDGRRLAYACYGDQRGMPVFFFHGTPGSRFFRPADDITASIGVRLICMDRPGYGNSTFQPGRRLIDWPGDIAQLADALRIDKFAVIGHSGGGPHALACAYGLPDRVTCAVTVSGAGPVNAPHATQGLLSMNRLGFSLGRHVPWLLWYPLIRRIYRRRAIDPARALDHDTGTRPAADEQLISLPFVRNLCISSEVEAFRPGMQGFTWDARLITRPWGFAIQRIKAPVEIWHGSADNATSVAMAHHMAASIPNSRVHIFPDEGHLLLISHWEEILSQLF